MRALLSVSDKRGVVEFARELVALGWELVSTGGTAEALRQAGLPVIPIERVTGFPEMMDGRVKTLHPKVHGGLLARRAHPGDRAALAEHGITPIDLVAVNLYPFRETVAKPGVTFEQAIEQIDIGGPSMLRSAAKNHQDVIVVVDPDDYPVVIAALKAEEVTPGLRRDLAAKVFVGAGDAVLVEQPSFLGALEAFRARGARVIGVPIEGDGLRVEALPGASALTLALAASGLNGQQFAFVGYLPVKDDARAARIRELDAWSQRSGDPFVQPGPALLYGPDSRL